MENLFRLDLDSLLYRIIAFVIAFTVHEWAHAYVAYKLGDTTARDAGRMTLNPLPHVDPIGLLMILFGPFGWAKPVPFNPYRFKGNRRLGIVLVAIAGPLTNLLLAFLFAWGLVYLDTAEWYYGLSESTRTLLTYTIYFSFIINAALFIFNLFPIAPLDGSKIIRFLLPPSMDGLFIKWEQYGPFLLLFLVLVPSVGRYILYPPFEWTWRTIAGLAGLNF